MLFNIKKCDVFLTHNKVATYRVTVEKIDGTEATEILNQEVDWSPRAMERGLGFIKDALCPPSPRKPKAPPTEAPPGDTTTAPAERTPEGPSKLTADEAKELAAIILKMEPEERKALLVKYCIGAAAIMGGILRLDPTSQSELQQDVMEPE